MSDLIAEYRRRLAEPSDIQGHLEFMHLEVADRPGAVVIELGTRSGNSTAALLAGTEYTGGTVWSCDIEAPQVPDRWYSLPSWRFLQADDLSGRAAGILPAECDVLVIDTSHEYRHTLAELRVYAPRVRPGGVVLMHDTEWEPPVVQLPGPTGEVAHALDTYCLESSRHWVNRPGCYGMGVIRL